MDALKSLLSQNPDDVEAADASRLSVPNASAKPSQSASGRGSFRVNKETTFSTDPSQINYPADIKEDVNGDEDEDENETPTNIKIAVTNGDDDEESNETDDAPVYNKTVLTSEEELNAGMSGKKSMTSSATSGSSTRPLIEGPNAILNHMLICLVALALNVLLIVFTSRFNSDFEVSIGPDILHLYGGVTLEIVLLVTNIITIIALDKAASVVFGSFLASKEGYSLTACGFMGASPFQKYGFAQQLLLSSKSRKLLSRISLVWILAELLKVLTPFVAVAFDTEAHSSYSAVSDCMVFIQSNKSRPVDRGHPTFFVEQGVGEYVFGSSLGNMRSEMAVE